MIKRLFPQYFTSECLEPNEEQREKMESYIIEGAKKHPDHFPTDMNQCDIFVIHGNIVAYCLRPKGGNVFAEIRSKS